jgi:hypothetical protein
MKWRRESRECADTVFLLAVLSLARLAAAGGGTVVAPLYTA